MSISMNTRNWLPWAAVAAARSATCCTWSTQTLKRPCRASCASNVALAGPTVWLLMWMSATPACRKGSASLTFWQQMPTAPRCSWASAMAGVLCALACGRRATPAAVAAACIASRLRSKASRSSTSAGVSMAVIASPGRAAGGSAGRSAMVYTMSSSGYWRKMPCWLNGRRRGLAR